MVVGYAEVGKTSLINCILNHYTIQKNKNPSKEERTDGVDVTSLKIDQKSEIFFWDFAGILKVFY